MTSKYLDIFHIIVPPRKVALVIDGISTSQYILKIQEEGEKSLSIDCIAKQSAPTPVFEWKLDGKNIDLNEVDLTDIFYRSTEFLTMATNIQTYIFSSFPFNRTMRK